MAAPRFHLAQANVARMRAPLDHPTMAGFVAQLDRVNALADASPGFVWRLQTEDGNATAIRAFDDDRILFNMSVWHSVEALSAFVYRGAHAGVFGRRAEWFEALGEPFAVLWWVPAGHVPSIEEGKGRLERLRRLGPTPEAFTFERPFPPPCPSLVILDYMPAYRRDWEALNLAWLEKYFTVEEVDRKILADPEREVLDGGGYVLLAALDGTIVGTCGLRRLDGDTFELVKMAVAEGNQGRGIGTALASAAIARARAAGARRIVLETNSRLAPALHVYRKLGFRPAPRHAGSIYARTDTALELEL